MAEGENKFIAILQEKLSPIAIKLDQNRYITAIKDGFFGAMSLIVVGSFFLLLANLPINGYASFMKGLLGNNWQNYFMVPYNVSFNIMTLYVIIAMAASLGGQYKLDRIACIMSALVAFLILTPLATFKTLLYIPQGNLSANGLFVGMIVAILAVEIVHFTDKRGWKIKMPDSVPENVTRSFSALIPIAIIMVIFDLVSILFSLTSFESVQAFIFHYLQTPLTHLGSTLPAMIIVELFQQILWSFGIHGANVVSGIMQPIWFALTAQNATAFEAGKILPNIIDYQFNQNFVCIGGSGATLGLVIYMLFGAKSQQYKQLGKLAIVPGIFNINEPIIFGVPIVLNPIMLIPFILTPLVLIIVSWLSMKLGLVPLTNGTNIPWTTPPIISGLLVSGRKGMILNIVEIFISMGIYLPFFKAADNMALENEK
ncbi:MAG: PTS sugar transporter subunit IIC [Sporolactobacillus sp.]